MSCDLGNSMRRRSIDVVVFLDFFELSSFIALRSLNFSLNISVLATLNERFRHCISMTKMLNSENLLADSGLEPQSTAFTADKILYNYAIEQCQAAALDELFGNPEECFQVCKKEIDATMHSLFTLTPPKLQFTIFFKRAS